MATVYTPVSVLVSATGATGVAGLTGAIAALNTATNAAITTAIGVTGYLVNSLSVGPVSAIDGTAVLGLMQVVTYTKLVTV